MITELKEKIKADIKWGIKRPPIMGGQQCGMPNYPVVLISEELNLEITLGYYRSNSGNKELAFTLFELALDELIK